MENTNVQFFEHEEFGKVRIVIIDGEPWFVGKDVATALGYANPRDALTRHVDDEDKGESRITTPYGVQNFVVINEAGLYALIFGSQLEAAKKFKHWVTHEVLPSIRKTGAYFANDTTPGADFWWEIKRPHMPTDFERGVQLKKLASHTRNPEIRETLILEAANLIAGEKIFVV